MNAKHLLKYFALVLSIALLVTSFPFGVSSEADGAYPSPDSSWYDPQKDEFEISTAAQLAYLSVLSAGGETFQDKTVKLTGDIVWNEGYASSNGFTSANGTVYQWTPLEKFCGTFDGQGYSVSGLYITGNGGVGFCKVAENAEFRNLEILNSYCTVTDGGWYSGTLVADVRGTKVTFENIHVEAYMINTAKTGCVGGIAGTVSAKEAIFKNCIFTGQIVAGSMAGGILGTNRVNKVIMEDCAGYGFIATSESETGALIGRCSGDAELTRCYAAGCVTASSTNYSGAFLYLDRKNHGQKLTKDDGTATVSFTDCYYVKNTHSAGAVSVHGTRCWFQVDVTYNGEKSSYTCEGTQATKNDDLRALFRQSDSVHSLLLEPDVDWFGDGTEDCYQIGTASELAGLNDLAQKGETFEGKTIRLTNDIVWNDAEQIGLRKDWQMLPTFKGTLDGQGHSIIGLVIYSAETTDNTGFCRLSENATFRNLTLKNAELYTLSNVSGMLAGMATATTFDNVAVDASIYAEKVSATPNAKNGRYYIGGYAGALSGENTSFTQCVFSGSIYAYKPIGGLLGTNNHFKVRFTDCANLGELRSKCNAETSGILGRCNNGDAEFVRCLVAGSIEGDGNSNYSGAFTYLDRYNATETSVNVNVSFTDCYYTKPCYQGFALATNKTRKQYTVTVGYTKENLSNTLDLTTLDQSAANQTLSGYFKVLAEKDVTADADCVMRGHQSGISDGKLNLRWIATLNHVSKYDEAGYYVQQIWSGGMLARELSSSVVYRTVLANYGMETVSATDYGCESLLAVSIANVPTTGLVSFIVTPYVKQGDTVTYGESTTVIYSNGIYVTFFYN